MSAAGQEVVADLGGSIITGVDGNPLAVLARQLGIQLHEIVADDANCPLYWDDGTPLDGDMDSKVRTCLGVECTAFEYKIFCLPGSWALGL